LVKELKEQGLPYKKILREEYGIVVWTYQSQNLNLSIYSIQLNQIPNFIINCGLIGLE
jgi:hypothetical protein